MYQKELVCANLIRVDLDLLSVPLHLNLLPEIAANAQVDALDFETAKDLYDKFWERKRALVRARLGRDARWTSVIDALCNYMSEEQVLSAPVNIIDEDDLDTDAKAMASEHVLTFDNGQYSFFHEGFFDYAFARRFAARRRRLVPFLLEREQHLFRRAQVRQILLHEREQARSAYLEDLAALLNDHRIRFHLKSVVFALLGGVTELTTEEFDIIRPMLDDLSHPLFNEAWGLLHRSSEWFKLADSQHLITAWLSDAEDDRVNRTVLVLRAVQQLLPDRVAELLEPHVGESENWNKRIAFVMQWSSLSGSRRFFDLFLRSIDEGIFDDVRGPIASNNDFWDLSYKLPEEHPAWACEVIGHFYNKMLAVSYAAVGVDPAIHIAALIQDSARDRHDDYFLKAARGAPLVFVEQVLPFMQRVMELTTRKIDEPPGSDAVWFYRRYGNTYGASDSLLNAMVAALSALATSDPTTFSVYATHLRKSEFETAQFLLVRAYAANGEKVADEAAEYLCERPARLSTGYADNRHWATRLLLQAITPHCSDHALRRLEDVLLN